MTQEEYHRKYFSHNGRPLRTFPPDRKMLFDYIDKPTFAIILAIMAIGISLL